MDWLRPSMKMFLPRITYKIGATALLFSGLLFGTAAQAASHLKGIKIAVANPSDEERLAEPVMISIPELRKIAPGLGVDIDEKLAAQFPYRRAYLPVNRKLDGTMHSW
jgi:hypothetical protein